MVDAYVPILLFILIALGFAIFTLVFASLIRSERYNKVKPRAVRMRDRAGDRRA